MASVLATQSVETDSYREIEHNGRTHWVVDVRAAKPMELNGGYVPASEFQRSVEDWEHVPLPLGHPVNEDGEYISARIPEVLNEINVGHFHNTRYYEPSRDAIGSDANADGVGGLDGEIWVDVQKAQSTGPYGELVLEMIENEDPIEVSTAYRAELGDPGVYNGEYREEVRVNLRPDHLALLPGNLGPGKCSVEDGCGTLPMSREQMNNALRDAADASKTLQPTNPSDSSTPAGALYCAQGDVGSDAPAVHVSSFNSDFDSGSEPVTESMTDTDDTRRTDAELIKAAQTQTQSANDDEWSLIGKLAVKLGLANTDPGGLTGADTASAEASSEQSESGHSHDGTGDSDGGCACSGTGGVNLEANQQEGDIVRWESDGGIDREPDDTRYGEVVNLLQDDDEDIVLVAVYAPDPDEGEWTNTGSQVRISEDSLEVIDEYPPMDSVNVDLDDIGEDESGDGDGDTSSEQNSSTDADDADTNSKMTNYDIEKLASQVNLSEDDLQALSDEQLENVAAAAEVASDEGIEFGTNSADSDPVNPEDDDDDEAGDDEGEAGDEVSANANGNVAEALNSVSEELNNVSGRLDDFDERIEALEANQREEVETKVDELKNEISANTDAYDSETLDQMSPEMLEATRDAVVNSQSPAGTDFSAIPTQANSSSSDEPESAGTLADYRANSGGD